MNLQRFCSFNAGVLLMGCFGFATLGTLKAGSDAAPVTPAADARPVSVQMDEYLKAQRIEHAVEAPTPANGQATTVKVYGVTSAPQQEAICTGLSAGGKHDRLQGVSVQFLTLENRPAGVVQTFQPSSLPSGNGNVLTTQRPVEKSEYKVQRTVKLQELAAK